MKNIFLAIALIVGLMSCTRDPLPQQNIAGNGGGSAFKYTVTLSSGEWNGNYFDENGTSVQVANQDSVWSYIGAIPANGYFYMYIEVEPVYNHYVYNILVTVKLYVDNVLVRQNILLTSAGEQQSLNSYQIIP